MKSALIVNSSKQELHPTEFEVISSVLHEPYGHLNCLHVLMQAGADVNLVYVNGNRAMIEAATYNALNCC